MLGSLRCNNLCLGLDGQPRERNFLMHFIHSWLPDSCLHSFAENAFIIACMAGRTYAMDRVRSSSWHVLTTQQSQCTEGVNVTRYIPTLHYNGSALPTCYHSK